MSAAAQQSQRGVRIPLTEVVYEVDFIAPQFSVVHYGEYFNRVKERFPVHRDVPPIVRSAPGEIEFPRLPRVWYEGDTRLIQLQADRFVYNWRKIENKEEQYPGFETIFSEFGKEWQVFFKFAREFFPAALHLEGVSLTYVNHIHDIGLLGVPIFSFRDNDWCSEFPEPEVWVNQFCFTFNDENMRLTVSARPVMQMATQKLVTQFELAIQSIKPPSLDDEVALFKWYRTAHDKIHSSFRKLVRAEWLEHWGFSSNV